MASRNAEGTATAGVASCSWANVAGDAWVALVAENPTIDPVSLHCKVAGADPPHTHTPPSPSVLRFCSYFCSPFSSRFPLCFFIFLLPGPLPVADPGRLKTMGKKKENYFRVKEE